MDRRTPSYAVTGVYLEIWEGGPVGTFPVYIFKNVQVLA